MEVLIYYKCNIDMKNTRFLGTSQDFVGIDTRNDVSTPEKSKHP